MIQHDCNPYGSTNPPKLRNFSFPLNLSEDSWMRIMVGMDFRISKGFKYNFDSNHWAGKEEGAVRLSNEGAISGWWEVCVCMRMLQITACQRSLSSCILISSFACRTVPFFCSRWVWWICMHRPSHFSNYFSPLQRFQRSLITGVLRNSQPTNELNLSAICSLSPTIAPMHSLVFKFCFYFIRSLQYQSYVDL